MTPPIDRGLLAHAKDASAKLIEAEKQVQIAKAEYHAEVRRLHLAGASLREIAAELGMSHQRVQQIVDEAGGSWWSNAWRNRTSVRDTACSFCGRSRVQVDKLISGPDFFICDRCVDRAEEVADDLLPHAPFGLAATHDRARCSFCGQRRERGQGEPPVIAVGTRRICSACLGQCRRILDESA